MKEAIGYITVRYDEQAPIGHEVIAFQTSGDCRDDYMKNNRPNPKRTAVLQVFGEFIDEFYSPQHGVRMLKMKVKEYMPNGDVILYW